MQNNIAIEVISISSSITSRSGYRVLLREIGGNRKIQMIVGVSEAQAMVVSMEKIVTARPLTHNLMQNIINDFELSLKYIQIHKYEDGVYYANALLEDSFGNVKTFDCRPSDAISLALRMEKPMFVLEEIFETSNIKHLDLIEKEDQSTSQSLEHKSLHQLKELLSKAVKEENYEYASLIQDEINKRI